MAISASFALSFFTLRSASFPLVSPFSSPRPLAPHPFSLPPSPFIPSPRSLSNVFPRDLPPFSSRPLRRFPPPARFSWPSFCVPSARSPNCPSLFPRRRSTEPLSSAFSIAPLSSSLPPRWILFPARTVVNISPRG